jgi:ABC-type lipoprotein release transport system permease subunit
MFSWALALRYLQRRWVNVLGTIGVIVAVWSLIVVRGVFSGFIEDIRTDVRRSSPDLLVTSLPHGTSFASLEEALKGDPDVVALAPRLRHYGTFFQRTGNSALQSVELEFSNVDSSFVQILGIDPARERTVTPFDDWLERARRRTGLGGADHAAPELGPELQVPAKQELRARRRLGLATPADEESFRSLWPGILLGRDRTRYNRTITIGTPLDLLSVDYVAKESGGGARAVTLQRTFAFAGTFSTGARLFDDSMALVPIEPLRSMLGHDAYDEASIDLCTDVAVRATAGLSIEQLRVVAARLTDKARAVLPKDSKPETLTWEQQNAVFLDAVDTERAMTTLVLLAVMLIAAFLIFATLHMMVTQKTKDIGILLALGGSPRGIGQIFTRCGIVIGSLGVALGVGLGLLTLWNLNGINDWLFEQTGFELFPRTLFDLPKVPYRIENEWTIAVAIGSFLLTLLVAWLPARKAARMQPVKALSYE